MKSASSTKKVEKDVLDKHYDRLAKQYDDFLYYSPDFVRALTSKMIQELDLKETDRFVDLGCGTGMYSLDILKQVPLQHKILGVDPYQQMLDQIPEDAPIERIAEDAYEFSAKEDTYDKVLIKETVHHIENREGLFANLYQRLSSGGRLLLVHVPPKLDYPLFEKALKKAERWHADPDELERQLKQAGFQVQRDVLDHQHKIPKAKYFQMVKNAYMSVLSSFSDEDLLEGVQEMEEKYRDRETLEFIDHFDYITGIKS